MARFRSFLITVAIICVFAVLIHAATSCGKNTDEPLLAAAVQATVYAIDEGVTLVIENTEKLNLFLPTNWEGVAIYRRQNNSWSEYYHPAPSHAMKPTAADEIVYEIPPEFLSPGTYRLVIQGYFGEDGTRFSLESPRIKVTEPDFLVAVELGEVMRFSLENHKETPAVLSGSQALALEKMVDYDTWDGVECTFHDFGQNTTIIPPGGTLEFSGEAELAPGEYRLRVTGLADGDHSVLGIARFSVD
ncbi:MAG: hypothetical protein FH749_06450 [Firmicutes bacterium]|nr:hypothetical protein [Bacillota bacterium]